MCPLLSPTSLPFFYAFPFTVHKRLNFAKSYYCRSMCYPMYGLNSYRTLGLNKCMTPSAIPSRVTALTKKMMRTR